MLPPKELFTETLPNCLGLLRLPRCLFVSENLHKHLQFSSVSTPLSWIKVFWIHRLHIIVTTSPQRAQYSRGTLQACLIHTGSTELSICWHFHSKCEFWSLLQGLLMYFALKCVWVQMHKQHWEQGSNPEDSPLPQVCLPQLC